MPSLTHSILLVSFYFPPPKKKISETRVFLMFSGGKERETTTADIKLWQKDFSICLICYKLNGSWYLVQKHCIRVASWVAERLKHKGYKKLGKNLKNEKSQNLVPGRPYRGKTLVLVVKNDQKTDIKVFSSFLTLLDFLTLFRKFCPRL